MPLKPDSAAIVALASSLLAFPDNALTDDDASTSYKHTMRGFKPPAGEVEQVERCWEEKVNEHITVRIYVPEVAEDLKPLPLVVYYHGGGWVSGDLDMHDSTCRRIANRAKVSVVNVDYRLAPESKFPAAYDDAYAAAIWARDHAAEFSADPTRLALTGS
ncbi:MAG: nlhH 3, partial [Nocardioidaceae bacterium]|nr:nlhH 3 [Nocardioidaceae bacterium]